MVSEIKQNIVGLDTASNSSISIGGFESFSMVDFPGKIAAVLFLKGCPWRCPFCYNTHLQKMDGVSDYDWDVIKGFLQKRKGMLDAVVFSGGEPLAQKNVKKAIQEVKNMGYVVGVHTGGHYPDLLEEIMPYIDWVGLDIKTIFDVKRYKEAVGGIDCLDRVSKSLDLLIKNKITFETRTTCDPRILDIDDIYTIAKMLKSKGVQSYNIQRYRQVDGDNTPDTECEKFFSDKHLEEFLRESFPLFELRK